MRGIGGNVIAEIQTRTTVKNEIGESEKVWKTVQSLRGWLDYTGGDSKYSTYSAKLQETTHIFLADYVPLADGITEENSRMLVDGLVYDVLLFDNPMGMKKGSQWEIFLRFTGGQ